MKAVVTVIGKDRVGIIFEVSKILSENNINILNISQTIMDGYFTMMMITDISKSIKNLDDIRNTLNNFSNKAALDISIQHENIFNSMHKI